MNQGGGKASGVTATDLIVSLLAFASGSADVFAFLKFHGVFTSAMTGNTALLGLAVGQGHQAAAIRSLVALAGFAIGNVGGTILLDGGTARKALRIRLMLGVECAALLFVALLWALMPPSVGHIFLAILIVVAAAAMGIQSVVARAIDLPGIPTVVFTTTLTMIMMALTRVALRRGPDDRVKPITFRQAGTMGNYLVGAALSGLLALVLPAALAIPALFAVGFALMAAFRLR